MKLEKYYQNKNTKTWLGLIYASLLVMILVSCTVAPKVLKRDTASFDGGSQNSGLVMFLPDGSGLLTTNAANRYNFLINIYKSKFIPPIYQNYGLTYTNIQNTNYYIISAEALVKFGQMNHWKRSSVYP